MVAQEPKYYKQFSIITYKKKTKMGKEVIPEIKWLAVPEDHDYPAAESYLNLILMNAEYVTNKLKEAEVTHFKVKDIFRASKLSLLGVSNIHVIKNTKKIASGKPLSPLLLVRDSTTRTVIIADGYHRVCSVILIDEDALIPCKIVNI
jgi:hypothetical protein